jgi:endoglycosylceramidase
VTRALAVLLAAGCGEPSDTPRTSPLWSDGTHLRDADGRVALLRGINARVADVFDVSFSDGRAPLEEIPPLTTADCARMGELGFDLLRLPINWSGIEPSPGAYDEAYLARVDDAIACAADAGLFVLVDLHQDAYSKEIGEDGAPRWAIEPAPVELLGGPLDDLGSRRTSVQVLDAFRTFFAIDDPAGLQAAFAAMLQRVAARWASHPAVMGFELFNEPVAGTLELEAFHERAAAAMRAGAPDKLVFFEPIAARNLTDFVPLAKEPFPDHAAVYSPHVYTYVFQSDQTAFQNATEAELALSVRLARDEAAALGTPLFIGEFGAGPVNDLPHAGWTQTEMILHDRYFASNAYWLWKEQSQGRWGLHDHDAVTGMWTERAHVVDWVSRIHLARIAGTPASLESSLAGDRIELRLESALDTPHVVYIPTRFAASAVARCDGVVVSLVRDGVTGLVEARCRGVLVVGVE